MAHANILINYEEVAEKLGMELTVGSKKATLRTPSICVEAWVVNRDQNIGHAKWITTVRNSGITYKDVVEELEKYALDREAAPEVEAEVNEPEPVEELSGQEAFETLQTVVAEPIVEEVHDEVEEPEPVGVEETPQKPMTKFELLQSLAATAKLDDLTEQEIEIVSLVKSGLTLDEIAAQMGLSRSTIEDKIRGRKGKPGILDKIGA